MDSGDTGGEGDVELVAHARDLFLAVLATQDPLIRLNAISELRNKLDELERESVRNARKRGSTWESIASTLRVTRQAVHKRYGQLFLWVLIANSALTIWLTVKIV